VSEQTAITKNARWRDVIEAYTRGEDVKTIGTRLGYKAGGVYYILRRTGIPRRSTVERALRPNRVVIPPDPAICAYLAGLLDGEGSIKAYSHGARATIANTNADVLIWIARNTGVPTLYKRKMRAALGYPRQVKPIYIWEVRRVFELRTFLNAVLPYLIIKRADAEKVLSYCNRKIGGALA